VEHSPISGIPMIQWYSNDASSNENGTLIDGATSSTYTTLTTETTGIYYYYCVLSVGSESVATNVATITVSE